MFTTLYHTKLIVEETKKQVIAERKKEIHANALGSKITGWDTMRVQDKWQAFNRFSYNMHVE